MSGEYPAAITGQRVPGGENPGSEYPGSEYPAAGTGRWAASVKCRSGKA